MTRASKRRTTAQTKVSQDPRVRSHAHIVAMLGSEILAGARKPGSRMPSVDEMFERFGVSRAVLREVTKTLAAKGMVTSKTRVGTLVSDSFSWNFLDRDVLALRLKLGMDYTFLAQITDIRRAVEPAAAALAAGHRSRTDIVRLRAAIKAMEHAVGNHRLFADADFAFHAAVSAATANPLFRSFTEIIEIALSALFTMVSIDVAAGKTSIPKLPQRMLQSLMQSRLEIKRRRRKR